MPDLKEQITSFTFYFRVGTPTSETCDMPKLGISDQTASPVSGKSLFSPSQKKARQVQPSIKNLFMNVFWLWGHCSSGIFSPKSNGWPEMLQGGFTTSKGARLPKRPLWWQYQDWLIHLDNTRVHIVLTVAILAAISGLVSMLADLAPYDLFSFPKVLLQLRIYRLKNMLTVLHAVPKVNYSCASISGGNAGPVV